MGLKIFQPSEHKEDVSYQLFYEHPSGGSGLMFDCDEAGNVELGTITPQALANLQDCQDNPDKHIRPRVMRFVNRWIDPARGQCVCGRVVVLDDPMDNDCACGRCYNSSGQEVQPNYGRADCARDGWAYDAEDY